MSGLFVVAGALLLAASLLVCIIDGPGWLAAGASAGAALILVPLLWRAWPGRRVSDRGRIQVADAPPGSRSPEAVRQR